MPIFSALSDSPRRAIGWPSKVVQMEEGVPGMLMRMADTSPPEMPPTYSPSSRYRAVFMSKA